MKKERIERLKAALLTVEREELARFEALPEPAVSPDFAERFVARLNEKPEKRPARPFPLRRLIVPVAAALALAFLFIVPVSADGRTLAGVVKDLFVSSSPSPGSITTDYTLDIPNKDHLVKKNFTPTSHSWVWKTTEGKTVSFTQTRSRSASFYERRKKEGEEIVRDGLSYYFVQKENESGYHVFWDTGEYGFELFLEGETDREAYFALIQTLHIDVPPPQKEDAFFRFTQPDGNYYIAQYIGSEDDPKIPAFYRGFPVWMIDVRSFQNCTFLTTIHIPASIRQIQFGAFEGCVNLKNVTLEKHAMIANNAFLGCNAIENLTCSQQNLSSFPKENLKNLKLLPDRPNDFVSDTFVSFRDCPNLRSLEIGEGFTSIPSYSGIRGYPLLEEIKLPQSLKKIDYSTFQSCKNLKEIILQDGLEEIGSHAFENCEKLETVTIPKSVTKIGSGVFTGCLSLREINVDPENPAYSSVDGVLFTKDGKELVQYPGGKTGAYRIPDGTEKVSPSAFRSCPGLTEITLPAGGEWLATKGKEYTFTLFRDCSALRAVWIDGDDPQIRSVDGVLFTKDGTTLLCYPAGREGAYEIPDGVTAIAFGAFMGSRNLTAVTLPGTVTEIRIFAFQKCTSLTSLHIPYSVTLISGSAFYDCDNLTAFSYDGTLAEWDAIQAKMDGIPAQYILTAADGTKDFRRPRPGQTTTAAVPETDAGTAAAPETDAGTAAP